MEKRFFVTVLACAALAAPAAAQNTMRAQIVGGGNANGGKCTIEVEVDGSANVVITGDRARLVNISGSEPTWRRFECTSVLPRNPSDFKFQGVDGRGEATLVNDPRTRGGDVIVRIDDREGGRHAYTFDVEWAGGQVRNDGRYRNDPYSQNDPYNRDDPYRTRDNARRGGTTNDGSIFGTPNGDVYSDDRYGNRDRRSNGRRLDEAEAVRACREAVANRVNRDGYSRVRILSADLEDGPGALATVHGTAGARSNNRSVEFDFTCDMNLNNGRVRSVQIQ